MDLSKLILDNDLSRLDQLLSKSVQQDEERKKKEEKRKAREKHFEQVRKDQERKKLILASNLKELEEIKAKEIIWEYLFSISHHVMQICSNCGNSREYHSGYYTIEQNTKNELKRLIHIKEKPIVYKIHYTQSKSNHCIDCENVNYMMLPDETHEHRNILLTLETNYLGDNLAQS